MKKKLFTIFITLILISGCGSSRNYSSERRMEMPSWYVKPAKSDFSIYGLGTAKLSNDSLSKSTATSRARTDIVIQISTRLKTVITQYIQEIGTENKQADSYINTINNKVINVELTDAVLEKIYVATDNTWYAQLSYPRDKMINIVTEILSNNSMEQVGSEEIEEIMKRLNSSIKKQPLQSSRTE